MVKSYASGMRQRMHTRKWRETMMKRIGTLLLVAILLCTATTALAGAPYVNKNNGYVATIPEGWIMMDSETIDEVMDAIRSGEIDGMDLSSIEQYLPQIEQLDMAMFMTIDGSTNYNVLYQPMAQQFSAQELVDGLAPTAIGQYKTLFNEMSVIDAGSVQTIGNFTFCKVEISTVSNGLKMNLAQYYYCGASTLYVFSFTRMDSPLNMEPDLAAIAEEVLTAFKPGN